MQLIFKDRRFKLILKQIELANIDICYLMENEENNVSFFQHQIIFSERALFILNSIFNLKSNLIKLKRAAVLKLEFNFDYKLCSMRKSQD